ncbi:RnfABCDGE type electron transport complex subunit D [Myxococcota bacterium]|nr:RnfABCDGE type electron transport complex subunit D [Myxococcota bacterium]
MYSGVSMRAAVARFLRDPRNPQLAVLAILLGYGALFLDFVLTPWALPVALVTALAAEGLSFRLRRADPTASPPYKSAIIAAFSSVLLFRSTEPWAYAAVAAFAIGSKVVFRARGRHFVNPTNGAVLFGSLVLPGWIASGQWGHDIVFVFVLASFATVTLTRAGRIDSAAAFLGGSLVGQLVRHFVLGYRWAEVGHHFTNGALWLFALSMITDPKTTPLARGARIAHALVVAALGTVLAQLFWVRDAFMWALLACAPLVPVLDAVTASLARRSERSDVSSSSRSGGLPLHDVSTVTVQ